MTRDPADEAAAVVEMISTALKVVAQAIELQDTGGLHRFIAEIEEYAKTVAA